MWFIIAQSYNSVARTSRVGKWKLQITCDEKKSLMASPLVIFFHHAWFAIFIFQLVRFEQHYNSRNFKISPARDVCSKQTMPVSRLLAKKVNLYLLCLNRRFFSGIILHVLLSQHSFFKAQDCTYTLWQNGKFCMVLLLWKKLGIFWYFTMEW